MRNSKSNKNRMDTERLNCISEPLLRWFLVNARVLPWREQQGKHPLPSGDRSYQVWVSEIMLQQTRVEAVKPYYLRFMEALPDVAAPAVCQEERLLKLWEGLGYYNRVRNMQKAAEITMEQYGGQLPGTYEELLALPGIGSYTAGAIASIAYGQVVPAVDGNVLRVVSRITGSREDISRQSVKKQFEELLQCVMEREFSGAQDSLASDEAQRAPAAYDVSANDEKQRPPAAYDVSVNDEKQMPPAVHDVFHDVEKWRHLGIRNLPGTFNQALMELGAVICLPGGVPDCAHCPVAYICYANEAGCQMELPVKASQKARRIEQRTVLVIRDSGRGAVRRRPDKGLLAGLYELPNVEGHLSQGEALARVKSWGFSPIRITPLPEAKHIFSHIEWRMAGYMVLVEDLEQETRSLGDGRILFIEPSRTEREYPIPAAFAAYTKYLSIRLGQEKYTDVKGEQK